MESVIGVVIVGLVAGAAFIAIERRDKNLRDQRERLPKTPPREIATVVELQSALTPGGVICLILLILCVFGALIAYGAARTQFSGRFRPVSA
jgi:L-cystine uptake protein TcyP (sodium:dicarboxylate symporter family)